ncbi:MAG: hypothetical protein NTU53_22635 [Planctomycetota bacterium]|nr:hypothetical protein [Planctomycetota bacterium]
MAENHAAYGIHLLFADGQVEWGDGRTARSALAELKAGINPPKTFVPSATRPTTMRGQ